MQWLNEPVSWQRAGDLLKVSVDPGTDFWRETGYGYIHDNGHIYGEVITGDLDVSVRVRADFTSPFDQAGVIFQVDEATWLKTGLEQFEGRPRLSTVLTLGQSSWTVSDLPEGVEEVTLRASRRGDAVEIRYSVDGATAELAALVYLPPGGDVLAGIMCAAPEGQGFTVTFRDLRIVGRTWAPQPGSGEPEWAPSAGDDGSGWAAAESGGTWAADEEAITQTWAGEERAGAAWSGEEGADVGETGGEGDTPARSAEEHSGPGWAGEPGATEVRDTPARPAMWARRQRDGDDPDEPPAADPTLAPVQWLPGLADTNPRWLRALRDPARRDWPGPPGTEEPEPPMTGEPGWVAPSLPDPVADWERLSAGLQAGHDEPEAVPGARDPAGALSHDGASGPDEATDPGIRLAAIAGNEGVRPPTGAAVNGSRARKGTRAPAEGTPGEGSAGLPPDGGPAAEAAGEPSGKVRSRAGKIGAKARGRQRQTQLPEVDPADEWISLLTADSEETGG
jgi:regulation of enolase protein 1 (concanavalin A-like superfamily)